MLYGDFKEELIQTARVAGWASGEGTSFELVKSVAQYLEDAEVLFDFVPAYYSGTTSGRRKFRVDGYSFDDYDMVLNLVIADLDDGNKSRSFGKASLLNNRIKLVTFIEEIINGSLFDHLDISTPTYDLADILRKNISKIRKFSLYVFTDAKVSKNLKKVENFEILDVPAEINIWDMERVFNVCTSKSGRQEIEIDFTDYTSNGIPCLEASSASTEEYNSYLCIIPGKTLADIYDRYGSQLLEGNVRSFLSTKVAVNKKIRETILKAPANFFAFNNGVSAIAKDLKIRKNNLGQFIVGAKDFQIINGGQTTASLSNARFKDKAKLDAIYVQMKLTEIDEDDPDKSAELIRNISKSSNSQNKVSDADFFSTHPFHIRMENYSRRTFAPAVGGAQYNTKWFYERARGQYLQEQMRLTLAQKKQFEMQNPKKQVITKTDLAKVRNSWAGLPHIVSKGAQANFLKYAETISEFWSENSDKFDNKYYMDSVSLIIIFRYLEELIPKQPWYEQGYRANIVTYTIALLRYLLNDQFKNKKLNLQLIWQKQSVPDVLSDVLADLAELVLKKITDPYRPIVNVTQWCKRPECWKSVSEIKYTFPKNFSDIMQI